MRVQHQRGEVVGHGFHFRLSDRESSGVPQSPQLAFTAARSFPATSSVSRGLFAVTAFTRTTCHSVFAQVTVQITQPLRGADLHHAGRPASNRTLAARRASPYSARFARIALPFAPSKGESAACINGALSPLTEAKSEANSAYHLLQLLPPEAFSVLPNHRQRVAHSGFCSSAINECSSFLPVLSRGNT